MVDTLSLADARRLAIAAQGFAPPTRAPADRAALAALIARLGVVQLDSVNVLARSHYLPAWSRLGAYAPADLDALAWGEDRALFEFWGHEASLLPLALHPLMRWRMARAHEHAWRHIRAMKTRRALLAKVLAAVEARGPLGAGELEVGKPGRAGWWEWSEAKSAIEWLFWCGQVTTASRRGFERLYDLTPRVLPRAIVDAPAPREADAQRALVDVAACALGVATARDLRDYYRLRSAPARAAIAALVEAGALIETRVEGWRELAYRHRDAAPARADDERARALSPFDSLIWFRERTERLFGMRYRIEIYTPAPKRVHGYYVLPVLLGDRLVARLDLKADREARILRVPAAHAEPGEPARAIAPAIAAELRGLATWLGLDGVDVARKGTLATALRSETASRRRR